MDGLEIDLEDFSEGFVAETIKYHNEAVKSLRNDYMTLQDISNINHNVDKSDALSQTVQNKATCKKTKIRDKIRAKFNIY